MNTRKRRERNRRNRFRRFYERTSHFRQLLIAELQTLPPDNTDAIAATITHAQTRLLYSRFLGGPWFIK